MKVTWIVPLISLLLGTGCQPQETPLTARQVPALEAPLAVGGDRDEHGCFGSAGYQWCAPTSECIRAWELPDVEGQNLDPEQKWQKWCQPDAS